MKILYFSNAIVPSRTANSLHVMKMCNAFSRLGNNVTLIVEENINEIEADVDDVFSFYNINNSFNVVKLKRNYRDVKKDLVERFKNILRMIKYGRDKDPVLIHKLHKLLREIKPDIIIGRSLLLGEIISNKLHRKIIFEKHQPFSQEAELNIFKQLHRNKKIDFFIAITKAIKSVYMNYGLSDDKIIVIPDGADEVLNLEKRELRGVAPLKVGYTGHLYEGKGIEVIEKIAPKLVDEVDFHIVGGLEKDVEYWKNRIISPNVYFYGFIPQTELSAYINSLDICLLPNQKNVFSYAKDGKGANIGEYTSPLKMFEYMAHKKPIIASDLPVLREILNENNAILVDPEKPEEWIEAIAKLRDKDLRERLAERAYSDFINNYTWLKRAEKLCSFFNK